MKQIILLLFFAGISLASFSQTVAQADTTLSVSIIQKSADVTSVSWQWTKISGPAGGIFSTPNQPTTNITGLTVGKHVIQCLATDNFGTVSNASIWNITVIRVGGKLIISAGADITLPAQVK